MFSTGCIAGAGTGIGAGTLAGAWAACDAAPATLSSVTDLSRLVVLGFALDFLCRFGAGGASKAGAVALASGWGSTLTGWAIPPVGSGIDGVLPEATCNMSSPSFAFRFRFFAGALGLALVLAVAVVTVVGGTPGAEALLTGWNELDGAFDSVGRFSL